MTRDRWIKSFVEQNKIVELVERKGNVCLYVTHSKEYDGRQSMYHVWQGDRWLYCGASYKAAKEFLDDT